MQVLGIRNIAMPSLEDSAIHYSISIQMFADGYPKPPFILILLSFQTKPQKP